MEREIYTTSDLWLSALLSSESAAELVDVQFSKNGRLTAMFTFEGENLSHLAQKYCQDQAYANVTRLRRRINDLRDLIFQARDK